MLYWDRKMKNSRIIELDYVRAISCIFILLYHYTCRYAEIFKIDNNYVFKFEYGYTAVSAFFILSGFLTLYNLKSNESCLNFIKKRAIRLYPVYWVAMIFTTLICLIWLPDFVVSIKDFIFNLTMFSELFKAQAVDGAYWTLLREFVFYLLIGVVIKLRIINKIPVMSFIWLCLLFCLSFVNVYFNNTLLTAFGYLIIFKYAQHFITGMMIYFFLKNDKFKDNILCFINIVLCFIYNYTSLSLKYSISFMIFTLIILIIVLNSKYHLWSLGQKAIKVLNPLSFLAAVSYPVYLIHQNFGYALIHRFSEIGITSEFIILIPIAFSILIGWLLNKFIAVPSAKAFNKIKKG